MRQNGHFYSQIYLIGKNVGQSDETFEGDENFIRQNTNTHLKTTS